MFTVTIYFVRVIISITIIQGMTISRTNLYFWLRGSIPLGHLAHCDFSPSVTICLGNNFTFSSRCVRENSKRNEMPSAQLSVMPLICQHVSTSKGLLQASITKYIKGTVYSCIMFWSEISVIELGIIHIAVLNKF